MAPTMGSVTEFRMTQKAIDRAAKKEVEQMYQLSGGGTDPVIDEASFEAFERGEIEEVRWVDFASYREIVLDRIREL